MLGGLKRLFLTHLRADWLVPVLMAPGLLALGLLAPGLLALGWMTTCCWDRICLRRR